MEKNELANLINNAHLFDIDREKYPERYARERQKFFDILLKYFFKQQKNQEYGGILIITADVCLKSYDKSKGEFLHYLNRAFKIEKRKQNQQDGQVGMKISQKFKNLYKSICNYAKTKNLNLDDVKVQQNIAKVLNIDIDEMRKSIQLYSGKSIVTTTQDKDGNDIPILDTLADKIIDVEGMFINKESTDWQLNCIETIFKNQQKRQKELLSMLITNKLCEALEDIENCKQFSFYNNKVAIENKQGKNYTQKEIGELFGKSAEHTSRVWNKFKIKLKENLGR